MSRCAKDRRVFFFEEPMFHHGAAELEVTPTEHGVHRVVPKLPHGAPDVPAQLKQMIDTLITTSQSTRYELWYYTPMALQFTRHLAPSLVVYDVMDELKNFRGAPPELLGLERELYGRADVVFSGGESLYQAKKHLHPDVHAFPSSVDVPHFARARPQKTDPPDQADIPHPRLGFFGVVDERMNVELVGELAELEPAWQLVMIGPVVKIDPVQLPRRANLHWLGGKKYSELPDYISGWDVAIMPFALNESTQFISPTKTPEFLAAGRAVISTPITDVVKPYGELELVRIANDAAGFRQAAKEAMEEDRAQHQRRADAFLAAMSWDMTWHRMNTAMNEARERRSSAGQSRAA